MKKDKKEKPEKDKYGMTDEDYKRQYQENLKRIGTVMAIPLGIHWLSKKIAE